MSRDAVITIVGNLAKDPELKFSNAGMAICEFGVAVNEQKKGADGKYHDDSTSWFNVVCFQQLAENCSESLSKGSRVMVRGEMKQNHWETDAGEKRSNWSLVADAVGPELRFATAQVERIQRSGGTSSAERHAPEPEANPFS